MRRLIIPARRRVNEEFQMKKSASRLGRSAGGSLWKIAVLLGLAALGVGWLQAQPGSLDPSFTSGLNAVDSITAIQFQPDGKLVVGCQYVGWGVAQGCVARLHPNGQHDPSFKVGLTPAGTTVYAVLPQPDGRIIVGGQFTDYNGVPCHSIVRVNVDGTIDPGFRTQTGIEPPWFGPGWISNLFLRENGKILISGSFTGFAGAPRTNLAQLNPDGTLDRNFVCGIDGSISGALLQPDGKLLVTGSFYEGTNSSPFQLLRLQPDGTQDKTFTAVVTGGIQ